MRDLVALSALPAVWTGLGAEGIARSLADALLGMLPLDFVCVRFAGRAGSSGIEVIQTQHRADDAVAAVRTALAPLLSDAAAESPTIIPDPFGTGRLNVVVTRFGMGADIGVLITGSSQAEFPTEQDRLLLGAGANQTAIALARLRTEAEVQAQREWLRVTLASIGDAVITTDALGRVTYLNAVAQQLTGWSQADALGRPLTEVFQIVNETIRQAVENPALRVLESGRIVGLANHTLLISRDGTERPIDDSAAPIRDQDGTVGGAVLIFRDISERKQAEAALIAREARYRMLVTATSDVVYLMSADWSVMQPLDGRDLVASNTEPIRDWLHKNVPASEHALVRESIDRAVANRQIFELEHRVHRPDGSVGWIFSRAVPIFNAAGQVVVWFGTARDVTEQRQAREDLARVTAESERQRRLYATVLSGTPDFVYVFSLDYRVLYANDALIAMWGRPLADTIGKTFLDIGYEPWHAEMHCREIDQVRATRQPIRGEVPFDGTNGRRIYDYIFVPVFGTDGEVEAVAGTTRDVTERKSMEDDLRHLAASLSDADRRKDEFLAMLAHELRNPLAPIRSGLEILSLAAGNDDETLHLMQHQVDHLVRLVDDLLDVSRIVQGKIDLRREPLDVAAVIQRSVSVLRQCMEQQDQILTLSLPGEPIWVRADAVRLAQVLENLLNNACKYTQRGGRIEISLERQGGEALIRVRDNGMGIEAGLLPRIFDLFTQADRTLDRARGGLGIGLTLVRRLVELHGGTITAESAGLRLGSTFVVQLPVIAPPVLPPPPPSSAPQARACRILVVDDNVGAATLLARLLSMLGNHHIERAHEGLAALGMAAEFLPEIILLDIGLPDIDGYEVARRLRQRPQFESVLLVALTGYGQEEDRRKSREAGFDVHLVKPPSIQALGDILTHPKVKVGDAR